MSDTLASLRRKLNAAEQLGAVVRAMKAVAASSIGQYEKAVDALGQYQRSVELALSLCLRGEQGVAAAPAAARDPPVGALVFGSDQGLVGRFNEVVGSFALEGLRKLPGPKTVWAVGERVCSCLEEAGLAITKRFAVPGSVTAITALVTEIQIEIETYTARERYSEVHVFHNSPQAAAHYGAASQRLLPLDVAWRKRLTEIPWPNTQLAEVLGGGPGSLTALVHEQLFISLYRACAESLASENASRLGAMQRAERNIESISNDLRHSLNRLRQSSIDEELFDVVAGFNALA
ncbi:MAG: alternate ATPase, subunit gamma [Gammaproteobacteria bacterium]|nr:alternate ATPase, subunit gamma [Gammaproteobacteria bacterium]